MFRTKDEGLFLYRHQPVVCRYIESDRPLEVLGSKLQVYCTLRNDFQAFT